MYAYFALMYWFDICNVKRARNPTNRSSHDPLDHLMRTRPKTAQLQALRSAAFHTKYRRLIYFAPNALSPVKAKQYSVAIDGVANYANRAVFRCSPVQAKSRAQIAC